MKNVGKYIIVFVIFVLIMSGILIYFSYRRERIDLTNDGKQLFNQVKDYQSGNYTLKEGMIYSSTGSLMSDKYLFGGNGNINIDEYGNISFDISYKNHHICKTKLGDVLVSNKCPNKELKLEMVKNNDTISFISNYENLSYKISKKDDFYGEWIKSKDKNIVISSYSTGDNYIWFKDDDGILSDVYTFNVDCLNVSGEEYDKNTFYCLGSKVKLDNKEWLVLESKSNQTTLMLADSLFDRYAMCDKDISNFCYYTKDMSSPYTWETSIVNNYLNNTFINELSDDTKESLVERKICNDYGDSGCNNSGCGGYLEEDINRKGYPCEKYVTSKIRIITYEEYNERYNNLDDLKDFDGNYWVLNGYNKNYASTVEKEGNIFILENPTSKKDVRPVLTISK